VGSGRRRLRLVQDDGAAAVVGRFREEPRYLDLRWARGEEQLSLAHPRFRECVAELAAPLHGRPKDELVGEDVRQHRRTVRLVRAVVASLTVLVMLATTLALVARDQRNDARAERNRARVERNRAISRQLTAQAPSQRLDRWLLLSLQATRIDTESQEARSALLAGLQHSSRLIRFLQGDAGTTVSTSPQEAFATQLPDALVSVNNSAAFSPDGGTLASGIESNTVTLWDSRSGRRLRTLTGHQDRILALAFSPDGKTLASASSDRSVILWDVHGGRRRGEPLQPLREGDSFVTSPAFSSDGRTLAQAMYDRRIILWDIHSGRRLRTLTGHGDWVTSMAFSPDGASLASSSHDWTVTLWDLRRGRRQATLRGHLTQATIVAFSPDGTTLASGSGDRTIILWDPRSGRRQRTLTGHLAGVRSLAYSPDGATLASGSGDRRIILWNVRSGRRASTLTGHDDVAGASPFARMGRR
jgi:Tol biopolymer transport system component